jgi:AcrR family transcriptional regulator
MARPRAHNYDAKRKLILARAAELFAQHGYGGASITMIAEACGISKALLYHYYSDKEAVLFDILSEHLSHLIDVVERVDQDATSPQEALHAIAAALLEAYRDADAPHQVQIGALKLLPPEKQHPLKELERELVRHFAHAIARAVPGLEDGLLKPVTMALFGMLNWHYLWFREGRGLSRTDFARLVTELIVVGAPGAVQALTGTREAQRLRKVAGRTRRDGGGAR